MELLQNSKYTNEFVGTRFIASAPEWHNILNITTIARTR